jgi:hypothetical protein
MSYSVVSSQAFICRHGVSCRRHVCDMSLVMSPTQENVETCLQMSAIIKLIFELKHKNSMVAKVLVHWADLNLSAVIDMNWVCRGFFSCLVW